MSTNFHVFELLAGLVGVIGALLVIATFVALPKFREHPSELILMVSVSDFFLVSLICCSAGCGCGC